LLEASLEHGAVQNLQKSGQRVLLIDEVDVFFSKDFYGEIFAPSILWQTQQVTALLRFVWQNRGRADYSSLANSQEYISLKTQHPRLGTVLDLHLHKIVRALRTFDKKEFAYQVEQGKIGYDEHGTINTRIFKGYNTIFAYFQAFEQKEITQAELDDGIGLSLTCGQFSYAEIPKSYSLIMGVTGTLSSLGAFEKNQIMCGEYKIRQHTFMPSMYNPRCPIRSWSAH